MATPKQIRRPGRWSLAVGAVFAALMVAAVAYADNVQNDVVAGGNDTFVAGTSTTVNYRIAANNGDGQTGCNAADASAATVTINAPAGVTATPSSLNFTSCGTDKPVAFTSDVAGDYEITVSVSDPGVGTYNTNPAKFTLHVLAAPSDTTPPTLHLPANIVAEAASSAGAVVTYSATADDTEPAHPAVVCSHPSGSTFPLGMTTVNCSATDAHDNTANGSFTVTVVDTTPPALTLPADITAEATGPSGAAVSYSASASDLVDGSVAISCSPASGSTFPLGATTVSCSATDAHGNAANGSFSVTVVDTTPPALTLPADITASATSAAGAVVTYAASASDLVDGPVPVNCVPTSGSTFAPGTTTVSCSASDDAGNTATDTFEVSVTFSWEGFFQPVDTKSMNAMKAGSTVPMKWRVSDGSGGYISSLSIVAKVLSGVQQCSATTPVDNLEEYATGGTQLRYDSTSQQYVYNWQSPKKPGQCFQVDIVLTDGSHHVAQFQLR